jgi:hypothetical protein
MRQSAAFLIGDGSDPLFLDLIETRVATLGGIICAIAE